MKRRYAGLLGAQMALTVVAAAVVTSVNFLSLPKSFETGATTCNLIPVGRFGAVDEVAEAAVMLARNGYMTGQTVNVNGGRHMS